MFLLLLTYTQPLAVVEQHVVAHRSYLQNFYDQGCLVCSGPQEPRTGGVILAHGFSDRAAVEAFVKDDPFAQAGVASYQILEFHPVKYAEAFKAFLQV